jgi:uncharacterized membrane protein
MSPYYNELPTVGMDEEAMIVLGVMLVFLGIVLVCCLVGWVLSSVGLRKVAKRRGIAHAWLAWLPIGREWVLGSVSDQYQHLVQGKITSRRKILLILSLVSMLIGMCNGVFSAFLSTGVLTEEEAGAFVLLSAIPNILGAGIGITTMVFFHICNFDLYRSCNPRNAVVFLVLGIVLPVCQPFFYFACRKKDLGMVVPQPVTPEPAELPPVSPEF